MLPLVEVKHFLLVVVVEPKELDIVQVIALTEGLKLVEQVVVTNQWEKSQLGQEVVVAGFVGLNQCGLLSEELVKTFEREQGSKLYLVEGYLQLRWFKQMVMINLQSQRPSSKKEETVTVSTNPLHSKPLFEAVAETSRTKQGSRESSIEEHLLIG